MLQDNSETEESGFPLELAEPQALARTNPGPKIGDIACRNCLKNGYASNTHLPLITALKSDTYHWTKQLLGCVLCTLMDTGAAASLLNASTHHKLFSHLPLQQPCTIYLWSLRSLCLVCFMSQSAMAPNTCHRFPSILLSGVPTSWDWTFSHA